MSPKRNTNFSLNYFYGDDPGVLIGPKQHLFDLRGRKDTGIRLYNDCEMCAWSSHMKTMDIGILIEKRTNEDFAFHTYLLLINAQLKWVYSDDVEIL